MERIDWLKITNFRNKFSLLLALRVGLPYHRFIGSSVHRFIGSSVHRFIGSSVHRFIGSSVHRFIGSSVHRFIGSSVHRFIGSSVHRFIGSSVHRFIGSSVHRFIGSSVHRFIGSSVHRFIGSSVHRFIGSSVHRFIGSSVHAARGVGSRTHRSLPPDNLTPGPRLATACGLADPPIPASGLDGQTRPSPVSVSGWDGLNGGVLGCSDVRCGRHRCEINCNHPVRLTPIRTDGANATRPIPDGGSLLAEAHTPPLADPHTYACISATPLTA